MKRMTYQQLEVIRERARARGLEAVVDADDYDNPTLRVSLSVGAAIAYYLDHERLVFLHTFGLAAPAAAEIDAVHATLTADFVEAPPPAQCEPASLWYLSELLTAECHVVEVPL